MGLMAVANLFTQAPTLFMDWAGGGGAFVEAHTCSCKVIALCSFNMYGTRSGSWDWDKGRSEDFPTIFLEFARARPLQRIFSVCFAVMCDVCLV